MRKMMTVLMATTALAFGANAIAADASYKAETTIDKGDNGSYDKTTKVESKDGSTAVKTEVNVDKDVSDNGDVKKTTTVEKTTDPKGLWNKQTEKVKETVKTEDGKTTAELKHTVNGKTVEEKKATY